MTLLRRALFALLLIAPMPAAADIETGYEALDRGDYAAALAIFTELAEAGDADARYALGWMLADGLGTPEDRSAALAHFREAAELGHVGAQIDLGFAYAHGFGVPRDPFRAEYWHAMAARTGHPMALNNLAYDWAKRGHKLDEALRLIESVVEREPDISAYVDTLGWVLYQMGRIDEALPVLCRAVMLEPGHPEMHQHLGDALWRAGYPEWARRQWQQGLALHAAPGWLSPGAVDYLRSEAAREGAARLRARLAGGVPGYPAVSPARPDGAAPDADLAGCLPPMS